jgi:hypothetical protein
MPGEDFDPFPPGTMTPFGLSSDDPLVDWGSNMKPSELLRFLHDPEGAINDAVDRGIPPPPSQALGFADAPFAANPAVSGPMAADAVRMPDQAAVDNWRKDTDNLQGRGGNVPPPPPAAVTPPAVAPAVAGPTETASAGGAVPLPYARPEEAGPSAAKLAEQKSEEQKKIEEALSGFSKSLAGVKAPPSPPFNPVGTPSVRTPHGVNPPNINQLLAMVGQRQSSPVAGLGRLLVQGKA